MKILEVFQNIVDIDKLKSYIEILEAESNKKIEIAKTERIEDFIRASISNEVRKIPEDDLKNSAELYLFAFKMLAFWGKETREILLLDLKLHEVALRKLLLDYDKQKS